MNDRNTRAFDGVIDFDAVVRDSADPTRMLPAYDKGDNLHPNDAGYKAMAESIDLGLLERAEGMSLMQNRSLSLQFALNAPSLRRDYI